MDNSNIQPILDNEKINVLLMGVSGSGKSTLINSIIGEEVAKTGDGFAITQEMAVYTKEELPFRLIDSVGLEYGFLRQQKIKHELLKWSKESVKSQDINKLIHAIWFCVDGQSCRVSKESLDYLLKISKYWKGIPIIIVITKSYSTKKIKENIEMFNDVFNEFKDKQSLNIMDIIPVVAKEYELNDEFVVPASGFAELIDSTNRIIPEALKINEQRVRELKIKHKRITSNAYIVSAATANAVVGVVPLKTVTDAAIITPLQTVMMKKIADVYEIDQNVKDQLIEAIAQAGVAALIGKKLVNVIGDSVPVIGDAINAVVAGGITIILGETTLFILEKAYKGEIDLNAINISQYVELVMNDIIPKYGKAFAKAIKDKNLEEIIKNAYSIFNDIVSED